MKTFSIAYKNSTEALMILNYLTKVMGYSMPSGRTPEEWIKEYGIHCSHVICHKNAGIYGVINPQCDTRFKNLEEFVEYTLKPKSVKIHCQTFKSSGDYIESEDFCFKKSDVQRLLRGVKQTNCITGIIWEGDHVVDITDIEKLLELE